MGGVKVFVGFPRKAGLSLQHFQDHWRHPHGTWGMSMGARTHYVQSHRLETGSLGDDQKRFDGVSEIWFDSASDAAAYSQDPVYIGKLRPDEPNFIDMRGVRFLVCDEEVLMSGPLVQNADHSDDLGWREFERPTSIKLLQFYAPQDSGWATDDDLDLGRAVGALRHVRCRPNPVVHEKGAFASGVRELWWPTLTAFERGIAAQSSAWDRIRSLPSLTSLLALAERHI